MITEATALELAQLDAKRLYRKLEAGAMPDDISRHVIQQILHRIAQFRRPRADDLARKAASKRITAPTFSEQLTARCMCITTEAMRALYPEDSRALGLWLAGTPPQVPGFLKHAISGLSETAGETAVEHAHTQILALMDRMRKMDEELFGRHIRKLSIPRQRIIRGLLLDAQWAFQEKDGITARMRIISARKTSRKWLKKEREINELLEQP